MSLLKQTFNFVRDIGGVKGAFFKFLREGTVRNGTCVGADKYGNKYYENNTYLFSRNRYVEYPYEGRLAYDGTQVPAEWHRWLHYITDETPTEVPPVSRKFLIDHERNYTGTKKEYVPYSTTRPKIEAWEPPRDK